MCLALAGGHLEVPDAALPVVDEAAAVGAGARLLLVLAGLARIHGLTACRGNHMEIQPSINRASTEPYLTYSQ